jgi:hypothetical protein
MMRHGIKYMLVLYAYGGDLTESGVVAGLFRDTHTEIYVLYVSPQIAC